MASFFSLQPSQSGESNLSKFASGMPGLEHVGNQSSYLSPTLGGGETLHSPFDDEPGNPATSGARGGNLMAATGDDSGSSTPQGGTSAVTGSRTPQSPMQQGGSNMSMSPEQIQALQTMGSVQQGLSAVPKSAVDLLKQQFKSSPDGQSMSDQEIDSFIESLNDPDIFKQWGALEGNQNLYESLNPSATEGYTLGAGDLDSSWLNEYTGTRGGTAPSAMDKFQLGDVQSALGVTQAAVTGDPAAIMASLNRAAPTVAKYITDSKDILKDVGSIAAVAGGAYSLYQGIQSGNGSQIAGGITQLLQGAGTSRIGMDVLSQLTGVSGGTIASAFGAVGGLTGAYSMYQASQNGDPVQALLSAASIYGALSTVAPSVFTPLTTLAGQALAAIAPQIAQSLGIGAAAAGTAAQGVASTASLIGAAAAPLAAAVVVIMAVTSFIGNKEELDARGSGWWNNPLAGQLHSDATSGVLEANNVVDQIATAGVENLDDATLQSALSHMVNSVMPYYATMQGGRGPIRASDTVTGRSYGTDGNRDPYTENGGVEAYQENFQKAQRGLMQVVDELMKRGMMYEQLGQIPVTGDWAQGTLDAGGRPHEYLFGYGAGDGQALSPNAGKFIQEGSALWGTLGNSPYTQGGLGVMNEREQAERMLEQALGGSMASSAANSKASNLMTDMYGGELWTALARMGVSDPEIIALMRENFDPWRNARTWAPGSRAGLSSYADLVQGQAYQDFTSGGM